MNRWLFIILCCALAATLALTGCGDKKKKRKRGGGGEAPAATEGVPADPAAEATGEPAAAAEAEAPAAAVEAEAPAAATIPSVEGVPDYEKKGVPSKVVTKAMKHNSKAVKHHGKKRYKKAEVEYLKALTLNPRYEYARYNLACAYALMGQDEKALGLLAQMKAVGTWKSLERVQKSKKDKDFKTLYNDPRFIAITADVTVEQPDYKKAAKRFKIEKKSFQPTFDDERAVRIVNSSYPVIDTDGNRSSRLESAFYDVSTVGQWDARMREWFPPNQEWEDEMGDGESRDWHIDDQSSLSKCKKNCCKSDESVAEIFGIACMNDEAPATLTEVCFWPLSADKLLPIKIKFISCL